MKIIASGSTMTNYGLLVLTSLIFLISCRDDKYIVPQKGNDLVDLNVNLQYPEIETYDSAVIVFKNTTGEVSQKLTLNNSTHTATGQITNLPSGEWKILTSYFRTLSANYKSLENLGVVNLQVGPTATDLISTESSVYIKDENNPNPQPFQWVGYYYYQLYLKDKLEGFVRLPQDPTNPFIEIYTYNQKWIYGYFDRVFYDSGADGASSYVQGNVAAEIYGTTGETKDRLEKDVIDITSLVPGIESVQNKTWDLADNLVMLYDYTGNDEIILYHIWDLRADDGGRIKSNLHLQNWSKAEIEDRKRNSLH